MDREADRRRAEARDLVTSWFLALWAAVAAGYLLAGGARHLVAPSYHYVLLFAGSHHTVAWLLTIAATINLFGVILQRPWGIAIGSILVGSWLAFMSFAMALAAWEIPDGGNLNMLTSAGLSVCFFIRAYNKVKPPSMSGALSLLALVSMWFV